MCRRFFCGARAPASHSLALFSSQHALLLFFTPLLQGLTGNCTEAVVLLHSLSERYRSLGDHVMAAGLLRRATIHYAAPISSSHLDAMLRAFLALGELLEGSGATLEECQALYMAVSASQGAAARLGGAVASVQQGIAQSQSTARERVQAIAAKLGR